MRFAPDGIEHGFDGFGLRRETLENFAVRYELPARAASDPPLNPPMPSASTHSHHVARCFRCDEQGGTILLFAPVADMLSGSCFDLVLAHSSG